MDRNWKDKLVNEINIYLNDLSNFKDKWLNNDSKVFITNVKNKVKKEQAKRNKIIENAIEFCKNTSKASKVNERAILSEIIKYLKKDYKDENILYYINEEEKNYFSDWIYDYNQLILGGLNFNNYKKYKSLIHLLVMIGGFDFAWWRVLKESPLGDSFAIDCQNSFGSFLLNHNQNLNIEEYINNVYDKNLLPFYVKENIEQENIIQEKSNGFDIYFDKIENCNEYPISEEFLKFILEQLNKNLFDSLMSFAEYILKYHNINISYEFVKFKELYEKTSEEIMVLDQRYYAKENLRLQEEALEQRQFKLEQEEQFRKQQLYLVREKNRLIETANEDAERRHQEALTKLEATRNSTYDTEISKLRSDLSAEKMKGHPDYKVIANIENKIRDMNKKRNS